MSTVNDTLKEWHETNKLSEPICEVRGSFVNIVHNGYALRITIPSSKYDSYIVENTSDTVVKWIDKLNIKIIDESLDLKEILDIILKKLDKKPAKVTKSVTLTDSSVFTTGDDTAITSMDIEMELVSMRQKLEKIIETSGCASRDEPESILPKEKTAIFSKRTVANILLEEFINIYKKQIEEKNIKISYIDNIYKWKIELGKFGFTLDFNSVLYPNYPPKLTIIKPNFNKKFLIQLANLKMIQPDYWTPTRSVEFIIAKLRHIFEKHGSKQIVSKTEIKANNLEGFIIQLANFIDKNIIEDIDDEVYARTDNVLIEKSGDKSSKSSTYWKSGVGYGHDGANKWDVSNFILSQNQKDTEIGNIVENIVKNLDAETMSDNNLLNIVVRFLSENLPGVSILEMEERKNKYQPIFSLIKALFEIGINLQIYKMFLDIYKKAALANSISSSSVGSDIIKQVCEIYSEYGERFDALIKEEVEVEVEVVVEKEDVKEDVAEAKEYSEKLSELKFKADNVFNESHKYYKELKSSTLKPTYHKRLVQEFLSMQESLPVLYPASIFFRYDEKNMAAMRVLMTGPHDTPYDSGCFIFDVSVPYNYPKDKPSVWFMNTGGVRFNPNLYDSGKVCLSLLGTWSSDGGGESWIPKTSTLSQVFLSIQSQILVEQPYFNEPGYERSIGTPSGTRESMNYNIVQRYNTMNHAIYELLKTPSNYPQFVDVIKNHFKIKKNHIIAVCEKWIKDAPEAKSTYPKIPSKAEYRELFDLIKKKLDEL